MRPFSACLLLVAACAQADSLPGSPSDLSKWEEYKSLHQKSHAPHEELSRFQRFIDADAEIQAHNDRYKQGLESFERQHTQYTDLTNEEFARSARGFVMAVNSSDIPLAPQMPMGPIPPSFDWRSRGVMTPVSNQAYCGSCYAFAGNAIVESYLRTRYPNNVFDISEQDCVDCSYHRHMGGNHNDGCRGGWPTAVFEHLLRKDITFESEYPYSSGQTNTHYQCRIPNARNNYIKSSMRFNHVMPQSEAQMAEILIAKGPLTIGMVADNDQKRYFQDLGNGVFDMDHTIRIPPNHAVALVGYGHDTAVNKPFWLIKNSWGTQWGVGGYGKIYRGKNMCNIMNGGVWYVE